MALIKEPKNVDFYVIDKPWSEKELAEFRELIKMKQTKAAKRKTRTIKARARKPKLEQ